MATSNRFFLWPRGDRASVEFHPTEFKQAHPRTDASYFCGILEELDARFPNAAIKFLMTWNLDLFDDQFENAVVILIGDEMYQTPSYISRVRAVFKTGGLERNSFMSTIRLPTGIAARVLLRDLRNAIVSARRRRRNGKLPAQRAPMYEVPLGTFSIEDVPFVSPGDRTTDVFFSGSIPVGGRRSIRPSIAARVQMANALQETEKSFPNLRLVHSLTVRGSEKFGPADYSKNLMNAKIALCPRGNFDETFRLFEAAKSACVIVSEPLPRRWYYENAPVIQIRGWSELHPLLKRLSDQPAEIAERSLRTRDWWTSILSEHALATYAAGKLEL